MRVLHAAYTALHYRVSERARGNDNLHSLYTFTRIHNTNYYWCMREVKVSTDKTDLVKSLSVYVHYAIQDHVYIHTIEHFTPVAM